MATTPKKLYIGKPSTSIATVYTVPSSTTTILKNIVLVNTTASDAVVTIQAGGQDFVSGYTVAAKDTVVIDLSIVLNASDTIRASQVTASAVNVFVSGVEVS